jgi:hypothetical protein
VIYNESSGNVAPMPSAKKGVIKRINFGIFIGVIIVVATVLRSVLDLRASKEATVSVL